MTIRVRRNVFSLSKAERDQYVEGVKRMKATPHQGSNLYDKYVEIHKKASQIDQTSGREAAHEGPAFLPWHRAFLFQFEQDMRKVLKDPYFSIPYWDWTADSQAPEASLIWQDDFMGGSGNPVMTGPFRKGEWETSGSNLKALVRDFGQNPLAPYEFPDLQQVAHALNVNNYDTDGWNPDSLESFRNTLEGFAPYRDSANHRFVPGKGAPRKLHNAVHLWIGGHMSQVPIAPNDPVFFLHHCNIDRIWAWWQSLHPSSEYAPVTGNNLEGHRRDDPMQPWTVQPNVTRPGDTWNYHGHYAYFYDTDLVQDFYLEVTTSDRKKAFGISESGTNSDVYLKFLAKGFSQEFQLDDPNRDDFEAGHLDSFSIRLKKKVAVGDLKELRFRMDHAGFFRDSWEVKAVKLSAMVRHMDYLFIDDTTGFYNSDTGPTNYNSIRFPFAQ